MEKEIKEVAKKMEKEIKEVAEKTEKEIKEVAERVQNGSVSNNSGNTSNNRSSNVGGGAAPGAAPSRRRLRCVVLTDSNGRGITTASVLRHMAREEQEKYDVELVTAYTLEEAIRRVERGEINIDGAKVIIDNLTNDVRGTRARPAATPHDLIHLIDQLRWRVMRGGAVGVVVCQVKPMVTVDVTPHNALLNKYLQTEGERGRGGFGCHTQVTLDMLRPDGYHVIPQYEGVIEMTYSCAIIGVNVPCPTPVDQFIPPHIRQRREVEWPSLGGLRNKARNNGLG